MLSTFKYLKLVNWNETVTSKYYPLLDLTSVTDTWNLTEGSSTQRLLNYLWRNLKSSTHTHKRKHFSALHITLRMLRVFAGFLHVSCAKGRRVSLMKSEKRLPLVKTGAQRRSGVSTAPQPHRGSRSQAWPGPLIRVKDLLLLELFRAQVSPMKRP